MNRSFTTFFFTTAIIAFMVFTPVKADVLDDTGNLLKTGNAKDIAAHFADQVELSILAPEKIYSRAQAETVLQDFFNKHHPTSVKIIHKLTSNPNLQYAELILNTASGTFRTSFSVKSVS